MIDAEDLLDDIEETLKAQLPAKIAAIEAEKVAKGKGITGGLATVESTSYYRQTWNNAILNVSPAIFYGIEDTGSEGLGPVTKQQFKFFVEVVVTDGGNDSFGVSRILRYSRAIKEVMEANFDRISNGNRWKVETVRPVAFKMNQDSSEETKVGGVSIITAIA